MCSLRNTGSALAVGLAIFAQASPAAAQAPDPALFAACAGRLSALMEQQWLFSDPGADRTAQQRDGMLSLIEATVPPGQEGAALSVRVSAKAAQAQLLATTRFASNREAARQAARLSETLIGSCLSLMLG